MLSGLGSPKCRRRTPTQGFRFKCAGYEKRQWPLTALRLCWLDGDGKYSKAEFARRQGWEKSQGGGRRGRD